MILPCFYNAPVSWYSLMLQEPGEIVFEQYDNYTKQTYRNRCRILGGNGPVSLVIPVVKVHGRKTQMKDTRIDYDTAWDSIHWKSIVSAYASAPYFEYFAEEFGPFYTRKYTYLADMNIELVAVTLKLLGLDIPLIKSNAYYHYPYDRDPGVSIHPKKSFRHADYIFTPERYHQVFADRHGFVADLSIIDLIFNEGPGSGNVLLRSMKKS